MRKLWGYSQRVGAERLELTLYDRIYLYINTLYKEIAQCSTISFADFRKILSLDNQEFMEGC